MKTFDHSMNAIKDAEEGVRQAKTIHLQHVHKELTELVLARGFEHIVILVRLNDETGTVLGIYVRSGQDQAWRRYTLQGITMWTFDEIVNQMLASCVQIHSDAGTITCWVRERP